MTLLISTISDLRKANARGDEIVDCGCWAGAVSACGRYPCPRRTMSPTLGIYGLNAPVPSIVRRIWPLIREWWFRP